MSMSNHYFKKIILLLLATVLMTSGFSCKLIPAKKTPQELTKKIELSYWGVWDETNFLAPVISDFQALHSNVTIKYKRFRYAEYEQQLLEAWAEDRGPDIYSLPAQWLKKYQSRITPQGESVQLAFQEVKKTLGKTEISNVVRSVPIFKPADIKDKFVDAVYDDVVINNKVYGLPLSVDTLALFYNRDLLDQAGVATPPKTWTELAEAVKKIAQIDVNNNPLTAGVALGTAENVSHAVDLLSILMMQNGTAMTNERGQAIFYESSAEEKDYYPGLAALQFYTDFSDPLKEVYTWNEKQPDALEAFTSGKLAMFFGYAYDLPVIKGRAPKLNFGLAGLPQIQNSAAALNYTNYWVETVSHKAKDAGSAWGFLNFIAAQNEVTKYLAAAGKPGALRTVVASQKEDPEIGIFAAQTLTAKRWYRGGDPLKMEEYVQELITDFPKNPQPLNLLRSAAMKINQTL